MRQITLDNTGRPILPTAAVAVSPSRPIEPDLAAHKRATRAFQSPILGASLKQIASSFGGFIGVCAAMYLGLGIGLPVWVTLPLAVPAAGFLVRIFIIQHDCGHGSFFRSRRANHMLGTVCSLLTLAPYAFWRRQHAAHHGVWNNLDRRRSSGFDIYSSCLTLAEYRMLGGWRRGLYRLGRHPLVSNILLPPLVFIILYRLPFDVTKGWRRERRAVYATDLAMIVLIAGLGRLLGYDRLVAVQLPIMLIAATIGVWLFSVQHRFEHTLWMPEAAWNFAAASLRGCSHLQLPAVLQWFSGNIGFHHVHHLNPRIPNYRLQQCHDADPGLQSAPMLTLGAALRALRYALWDDEHGRMVRFPAGAARGWPRRNRQTEPGHPV